MTDGIFQKERQQTRFAVGTGSPKDVFEMVVNRVLAQAQPFCDERNGAEAGEQQEHDIVFTRGELVAVRETFEL